MWSLLVSFFSESLPYGKFDHRRGYEALSAMAAPVRTNQVNQIFDHPRTTFRAVIVNANKRFVLADALAFIPNYQLCGPMHKPDNPHFP